MSRGTRRPKSSGSSPPRTVVQSATNVTLNVEVLTPPPVPPMHADTAALIFVQRDLISLEEQNSHAARDFSGGAHGRFAAPGNAVRRQVQLKPINPRTADELAGFLRDVSYTLTEVRQGEAVPPIKVERVRDPTQSKRQTILWFAKDWDYLLVRLHQVEKDGKEYQIMLQDGSVNGQPVKGN